MGRFVRASLEILRLAVRRERLPEEPPAAPRRPSRRLLATLFPREELALEPERPPREGPGILRTIFGREELPLDPPAERPHRRSWLATLFPPERLDPP